MLRLVVPEGLGYTSGGTVYNTHVADALRGLGVTVEVVGVPGAWPVGTAADRRRLRVALDLPDAAVLDVADAPVLDVVDDADRRTHEGGAARNSAMAPASGPASPAARRAVLVDALLVLGAPEELHAAAQAAASSGAALGILVHMSLADAPGLSAEEAARSAALECEALAAAHTVLVPSDFAARRLAERYGTSARVARPGVVRVPAAPGSLAEGRAPHLLCLAALLPGKGQLRLVRALGELREMPWTLTLAGHDAADPAYAHAVAVEAARLGIADRVLIPGELRGPALETEWSRTDLTVLASVSETFGLAVAESIARGVPAMVGAGTGAAEALSLSLSGGLGPAGAVVGNPGPGTDPLTAELGRWLADLTVRARWRAAARAARPLLPGWESTALGVARALGVGAPRP
ncbi:glycosyltransferase [Sinomonas sp. P10A9]|uniref:Glycosyltransferase n=1 Tax=Sinomonas puerhi TaxID=3238584 RepID=A0AB39L5G3_9MICC